MKTSKIVLSLFLVGTLSGATARAADPQPAAPSAADIQALMAILNKLAAQAAAAESAPTAEPEPAPEPAPAPTPAAKAPGTPATQPLSTALKTGSLGSTSLAPSGGLGGHGPAAAVARLTEEGWRLLFPAKQTGH